MFSNNYLNNKANRDAKGYQLNVLILVSVTAREEEIPTASAVAFVFASVAKCLAGEVPMTSFALLSGPMASIGLG
jgi:hypothetical protein